MSVSGPAELILLGILVGALKTRNVDFVVCAVALTLDRLCAGGGPGGPTTPVKKAARGVKESVWINETRATALSAAAWPAKETVMAQGRFSSPELSIDACSNIWIPLPPARVLDIRPVLFYLDTIARWFVPPLTSYI